MDDLNSTRASRKKAEPCTPYEFCKVFSQITGRPLGLFLRATKHWPMDWFFQVQSECKDKPINKQAICINWFVKKGKLCEKD